MKKFIFGAIVAIIGYAFFTGDIDFYEVKDSVLEFISEAKATSDNIISEIKTPSDELISQTKRYYYDIDEDEIPVFGEITIYANPKEYTITVKQKGKDDKTFKMDEIPDIYFSVNDSDGIHYSPNLPCIYDGKFGLVNEKGNIVEPFRWDAKKYYMVPESNDILIIERKNESNFYLLIVNENKRDIFYYGS